MDRELEKKINEEVEKILDSYNDESIKTEHNFNVLKQKLLREKYQNYMKENLDKYER